MRNLRLLIIILSLTGLNHLNAQTKDCCRGGDHPKTSLYIPPKFIDSASFINDVKNKIDLKSVFDHFKRDTLLGLYRYSFDINMKGRVIPVGYDNKDDEYVSEIHQYILKTFNYLMWKPGYKKKCKKCKTSLHMELQFSFDTTYNTVEVVIVYNEYFRNYIKNVFDMKLNYGELKSFN